MPRAKKLKRKNSAPLEETTNAQSDEEEVAAGMCFSQQPSGISQQILPAKASEQRNLDSLPDEERDKILMDLSRLILFKALAGETIERKLVCKEAGIGPDQGRICSAAFAIAAERLKNVFGFDLKRLPKWMEDQKSTKKKYCDRHYLILSDMEVDQRGDHSKAMYGVHKDVAVEKGLLMVVLALIFCKGDQRSDGSRWILDSDLYKLLNVLDESIPNEPPAPGAKKGPSRYQATPNIDIQLEQFTKLDYIVKEKITDEHFQVMPAVDENAFLYALGPRTAVEIGRKQILYFCAEILDEGEPDPAMLEEIERDEREEEMEEEG